MDFNLFNPSVNILQSFKLIFSFQTSGIILMEYDCQMVNLKLFANPTQISHSGLIFSIGSILFIISCISIRRQK